MVLLMYVSHPIHRVACGCLALTEPIGFLKQTEECGFNSYSAQKAKAETSKNGKLSIQMHKLLLSLTAPGTKARTPNTTVMGCKSNFSRVFLKSISWD